jgi:hypothetical protein
VFAVVIVDKIFYDIEDEEGDKRGEEEMFGEIFVDITEI